MTETGLPLAGLRVLDISSFIAAPAAAVVLGDWGADVIKIEGPDGDANRKIMHDSANYPKAEVNYPWHMDSRNKRSLTLDLKQPAARAALDRLLAVSDIVICNFPPPVRDKLRLTYDDMKKVNPKLIYASLTGYGETGPDRDRPGFDVTAYFARSGLLDAQRYEGGPPGVPVPAQGDRATAMTLVSAILMALVHRMKTGEGSWVGTSLLGNGLWSCGVIAQAALVGAFLPPRPPPERPRTALGNIYRTKDDRWIQLTIVREDKLWAPLCRALEKPELIDDPRFAEIGERRQRSAELAAIFSETFATQPYEHWRKALAAHEITFGVISRPQDVPDDEQAVHAGAVVDTAIPEMPRTLANPIRVSFAEQRTAHPAPTLGQHTDEILSEVGLTTDEIAGLRVLDISSFIAAPAAAVALADFGADVIKIEPPIEGDPHRNSFRNASYPQSDPPDDRNFPWQLDGRHKRSIALDLKNEDARKILDRLLQKADVLIVNFPPPARERLRLRWEDIEPINPRLVYCSLTGYGESGPDRDRPGFDITAYFGRSGILDSARYEDGPPGLSLPAQGDRATAMTLVAAILLGLRRRDQTGKGGWVGTSLYANGVWANGTSAAGAVIGARLPPRHPPDKPRNALTNLYRTKDDRWLQLLMVRDDRLWEKFCAVVERPDLLADARYAGRPERRAHALELGAELVPIFAARTYAEWEQALAGTGIPFGVIGRLVDVVDDEQAEHAGIFADTTNPEIPRTVNNPIRLGFAKPRPAGPPPAVGQHNDEILRETGFSEAEIAAFKKRGALG